MNKKIAAVLQTAVIFILLLAGCKQADGGVDTVTPRTPTAAPTLNPTPTLTPTPYSPDPTQAYYINIPPQTELVANNRVDAFAQGHAFIAAFQDALADEIFTPEELLLICQLAANAEASLYNTGDHQIFTYARQIDQLAKYAVFDDLEAAGSGIVTLQRTLPGRPQP